MVNRFTFFDQLIGFVMEKLEKQQIHEKVFGLSELKSTLGSEFVPKLNRQ